MKLVYPAYFYLEDDGGYSVIVPDLIGCQTQGNTLEEAIQMANDAALGWLLTASKENTDFPMPSNITDIKVTQKNSFTSLLFLDLESYFSKHSNESIIKKTLEIPTWLNEKAEKQQIDFSKTLNEALLYKITYKKA